jgi:hypothetical protein
MNDHSGDLIINKSNTYKIHMAMTKTSKVTKTAHGIMALHRIGARRIRRYQTFGLSRLAASRKTEKGSKPFRLGLLKVHLMRRYGPTDSLTAIVIPAIIMNASRLLLHRKIRTSKSGIDNV